MNKNILLIPLLLLTFSTLSLAEEDIYSQGNRYVSAELISDVEFLPDKAENASKAPRIAINYQIADGWHIYWLNSGDSGAPTTVSWSLPSPLKVSSLRWPAPLRIEEPGALTVYGYRQQVVLIADLLLPNDPILADDITVSAEIKFLVCKHVCVPGKLSLSKKLRVTKSDFEQASGDFNLIDYYDRRTPKPLVANEVPPAYSIVTGTSHSILAPGDEGFVFFKLTGPSDWKCDNFTLRAQVFPYKSEEITFRQAEVVSNGKENEVFIRLPFVASKNFSSLSATVSGVISFAKDTIGSEEEISYQWSLLQNFGEESQLNPTAPSTLTPDSGCEPLQYKSVVARGATSEPMPNLLTRVEDMPGSTLIAISFGFLAGLLLNIMPCVLPVLSLKVMSIIAKKEATKRQRLASSLVYCAGILACFVVLSTIIVAFKSAGQDVGWGFQFQHAGFVLAITLVIFLLSLSFFDLYYVEVPGAASLDKFAGSLKLGTARDFLDGVLAALLSTPCSAPLLGTALAFAFAHSAPVIYAVFISIGLGLSSPYLLVANNEKLFHLIPRPGKWLLRVKEVLGLLMLSAVVWLLFVIHRLTEDGAVWATFLMLVLFTATWMWRWFYHSNARKAARLALVLLVALIGLNVWGVATAPRIKAPDFANTTIQWQPYSDGLVKKLSDQKKPIFIMFTAEWCITCAANERLVLETNEIQSALVKRGIVPLKADWTSADDEVTAALRRYGGKWVPYYVAISGDGTRMFFPGPLLTKASLIEVFEKLEPTEAKGN